MITQEQTWPNLDRHILITENGGGSVQIELYNAPMPDGTSAYIYALWVDPDQRRKGIATDLMNAAEELIAQEGYPHATLSWSPTEAPQEIRDWYIRRGYKAIGRRTDEVILRKQLRQ